MKTIQLDRSKFEAQRGRLRSFLDKKFDEAKRELEFKNELVSIRTAQRLAEQTFPSSNAIGLTVGAVRFDISRVFITASGAYRILKESASDRAAAAFYAAYKRGDISGAQRILRASPSPIRQIAIGSLRPDLHEQSRNDSTGRVERSAPAQIVPADELASYTQKIVAEIGKTAAGWNACCVKLGGSQSETRWKNTSVHGSSGGDIERRVDQNKASIVLINRSPLAQKHISPSQLTRIIRQAEEELLENLRQ